MKTASKYRAKETMLNTIKRVTGKGIQEIREEKGVTRQVAMEFLYRVEG
jgi:DNA-binding transcriptional regulator YiaG